MVEAQGTTGADEPPIQSVGRLGKNTDHSCSQYICELPNVQLYRPCILIVFLSRAIMLSGVTILTIMTILEHLAKQLRKHKVCDLVVVMK